MSMTQSDEKDFDPIMAMYLLVAKRVLAAARVLHDNLMFQDSENAMMAALDLMGATSTMMENMAEYLTYKTLETSAEDYEDYPEDYLTNKYYDLLMQASNNDPMVMLGEEFDAQVKMIGEYFKQ